MVLTHKDFLQFLCAQMVELVDTRDLGSRAARCAGSTPVLGTIFLTSLIYQI